MVGHAGDCQQGVPNGDTSRSTIPERCHLNYHAHIPAGIAFAATACLVTQQPLSIPMVIAGAIGGALPDIDHPSGNGAVSSLGKKAGQVLNSASGHHARFLVTIGAVFDAIITKPIVHLWLAFARGVLSPLYMTMYQSFGKAIGWSGDDPSEHRGGLTHSLMFIIGTSLIMLPISAFLLHDCLVWIGLELGILSHLFADSVCKSGIKWFWPWTPKMGFYDGTHEQGNGIRLLPVSWCMSTGKCPTKEDYLCLGYGTKRYKEMRSAYYKEKGWQWAFKALAVTSCFLCLTGVLGSGGVAWGATQVTTQGIATRKDTGTIEVAQAGDAGTQASDDVNATKPDGADATSDDVEDAQDDDVTSSVEDAGPTSLTAGDIDAATLPKGIIKLPDESLWVVGVGRVTADTLESPSLMLSKDEKARILAAATAQRLNDIPDGAATAIDAAKSVVGNATNATGNAISNVTNTVTNATGGLSGTAGNAISDFNSGYIASNGNGKNSGGISGFLGSLGSSGTGGFGFLGLTPYTDKPSSN